MTLYIISGANGSGKTTFAKLFAQTNELYFINADEIAKELDSNNITKYKVKAGKIFFQELKNQFATMRSFVIETTLSGKYLIDYINQAKHLGYEIKLIYIFLEKPTINIMRVNHRVLNGGHNVPQEDIIRRFYRSKTMFWNVYKNIVNSWSLYYNSDEIFEKVADNGKILDEEKYNIFLKDIK
jgi:predicted ABC-type ATPase